MSIGRIPENILEDILNRVDIVELISGFIPLKRAGRNFKAVCPFHQEKTPSFMVSPDRQIYHCFGCGAGGNAFNFLMQYERLEFIEAVETLARRAGVALPQAERHPDKAAGLSEQLYKINEQAASFYESCLGSPKGSLARTYLVKRGINQATAKLFKLGYAPDSWDALINHLREKAFTLSLLEKAGLALSKAGGGYYDRFRERIIFPIFDIKSRVLAFGGRVLPDAHSVPQADLAKYVNSPETPVYVKGRHLYGLNFARESIREKDFVAVVEGYLDFIMPFQAGFKNIVASLGTALTSEQARLIKRYTQNVVMVYDADNAGEMATLRTLDIFIDEGMKVKVAPLPQGFDPDLFVRKHGVEEFSQRIKQAQNLFDYKLKVLKGRHDIKDIEGKAMISSEMLPTINRFSNAILKTEYLRKLAQELSVGEEALFQELKKVKDDRLYSYPGIPAAPARGPLSSSPTEQTEKLLVKLMLEEAELINQIRDSLKPDDFQDQRVSRIVSLMFRLIEEGKSIEAKSLINHLNDSAVEKVIHESSFLPDVPQERKGHVIDDCIKRLKVEGLRLKRQKLHEAIKAAQDEGDEEKVYRFMKELHGLIKER